MSSAEYEAAVAAFIRTRGVTRCPTACVVPTQATIADADRAALHRRWAENESLRNQEGGRSGLMLSQGATPRLARDAGARGRDSLKANADRFAASVLPIIMSLQADGIIGLSAIADALNARGIGAPRGGKWRGSAVRRLLARAR
ncbi:MAG TPA: hypothetical protein VFA12_08770 [Stellaceae bacterium]|nr:hypothetical protein [Stellaceae bacterium]